MNRTEDTQRAAALATLLAYGSHLNLKPHTLIKDSEATARMTRMQAEYLELMRRLWPDTKLCDTGRENCRDEHCPVHGRDT